MKVHTDNYPQYVSFDKSEKIFLWKKYFDILFKTLDKDTQIKYLLKRILVKDSSINVIGESKDIFLYSTKIGLVKVGFVSYFLESKNELVLNLIINSNINFKAYDFTEQDDQLFNLDKVNVPFLGHGIMIYLIDYAKKNQITKISFEIVDLDISKKFFSNLVDYLFKKNLLTKVEQTKNKWILYL